MKGLCFSITKLNNKWDLLVLSTIIAIFTVIFSFISFQKHDHFQTFAWDTSFFVQELYHLKNLHPPLSSLYRMNALGDHFQIFFLTITFPFYLLWSNPKVIFFVQALLVSVSAIPLYKLSNLILSKRNLSTTYVRMASLVICFSFLFSVPIQAMVTDEFHNDPIATLPLISLIYFIYSKNTLGFWISFICLLITKETYGLFSIPIGLYIYLSTGNIKKALTTISIGLSTFLLLVYLIMPKLSPTGKYFHYAEGNHPSDISKKFLTQPLSVVTNFIDTPEKVATITISLAVFAFIPLFSGYHLLLPLSALALRFYDDTTPLLYRYNNHYASPLMPFLAVATIFGVYNILKFITLKRKIFPITSVILSPVLLIAALILSTLFLDIYLHGPINSLAKKSFYDTLEWEKNAKELISKVPDNAIIASQNSLLPHLSEREDFYLLPKYGNAEYIAVDLSDGPNKFSPLQTKQELSGLIKKLQEEKNFQVVWQKGEAMLLQRN